MTRHKIGKWRDGERLDVRFPGPKKNPFGLIVGVRAKRTLNTGKPDETEETLFVTYAGASRGENMLDAFDDGFRKGFKTGQLTAKAAIRRALGVIEP